MHFLSNSNNYIYREISNRSLRVSTSNVLLERSSIRGFTVISRPIRPCLYVFDFEFMIRTSGNSLIGLKIDKGLSI